MRKTKSIVYFIARDTLDGTESPYSIHNVKFYSGKAGLRAFSTRAAAERSMKRAIGYDEHPEQFTIVAYTEWA